MAIPRTGTCTHVHAPPPARSVYALELQKRPPRGLGDSPDDRPVLGCGAAGVDGGDHHLVPDAALVGALVDAGDAGVRQLGVPAQAVHQHREAREHRPAGVRRHDDAYGYGRRLLGSKRGRCARAGDNDGEEEEDGSR